MNPHVQEKILKYESFVNDVLRNDLAKIQERLDEKNTDIAEFIQLKTLITALQDADFDKTGFKTKVDIGNNYFVQANITDASQILLDVGLGHFVEFTLEEALVIINIRIKLLERQIAHIRKQVVRTNAHIKTTLIAIRELQGLN